MSLKSSNTTWDRTGFCQWVCQQPTPKVGPITLTAKGKPLRLVVACDKFKTEFQSLQVALDFANWLAAHG